MKAYDQLRWYLHRLRAMNLREVWHRAEERFLHLTEAGFLKEIAANASQLIAVKVEVPRLPDATAVPLTLRSQLAEDARRLQRGEWDLFGWKTVDVGAPPCWHRDAACGVVIDPEIGAHRLNHRSLRDDADARTIWEINRWAEMTRLAMQGWLNGDLAAVRTAQLWLEDWCDRNPPGQGINWTSPLEAALRLLNFCWFDALVCAAGAQSPAKTASMVRTQGELVQRIVPVHAAWVWRYRSNGSSANNHLLGELTAITVAASRWPELAKVSCTADEAWESLGVEVLQQFAEDGGSREQALHYHLFAFEMAWQAVKAIGCKAGEVYDRLILAAQFFADMAQPVEPWNFGDSDDAQVLPFTLKRAKAEAEWKSWILGEEGALRFWLGESPVPSSDHNSALDPKEWRLYPQSGVAVFNAASWKLRLDGSPLGFGGLAAHGHCDALHLSIWDGDDALIIDPGTGGYFGAKELREELAGWGAHNGPQSAEGFRYPERMGTFLQVKHHAVPKLISIGSMAIVELQHEGHGFQRRVRVRNGQIEINDSEDQQHPFHVAFHFAPQCKVTPVSDGDLTRLRISRGNRQWELTIEADAKIAMGEARVSSTYHRIETATMLSIASSSALYTRLWRVS